MTGGLLGLPGTHPAVGLVLMAVFFALAVEQALHVSRLACWRVGTRGERVYECALFVLLVLGFCDAHGLAQGLDAYHDPVLRGLAWAVCLAVFACGGALWCMGHGRRRGRLVELACAVCLLPAVALALGACWGWAVAACAAVLAACVTARLLGDERQRAEHPARDAMAQAVQLLPAGVLCTGADGRVLFMNDAMRARFAELGLPGDLANQGGAWEVLEGRARRGVGADAVLPEGLRLEVGQGRLCLFTRGTSNMAGRACRWVAAVDVTEREHVVAELAQATHALEQAGVELRAALADVDEVARNEALAAMRSRVHDVAGQRLSILHRYLEDGADAETFAQVAALIEGMAEELRAPMEPDAAVALAGVVDAFALAGVGVRVEGELPAEADVAGLFVRAVRECATNAVRHGRARAVLVRMAAEGAQAHACEVAGAAAGPDGDGVSDDAAGPDEAVVSVAEAPALWYTLAVSNDGLPCTGAVVPGGGLGGMQAACARLGAALEVEPGPPFAVRIRVPRRAGGQCLRDVGDEGGAA